MAWIHLDLAFYIFDVDFAELLEVGENREVFRNLLGLLPLRPFQECEDKFV